MLIVFVLPAHYTLKDTHDQKKTYFNLIQSFYFQMHQFGLKYYAMCQLNKPYPNQKQIAEKHILKDKVYTSITEFHLIQEDQDHHPQKESHLYCP